MEMGGVYAVACLRGGGEYGEAWHEAGKKLKKQNVFDDFIAAAEWLIANKYTQPKKLAIHGGSNGGLLVGAAMIQRPDLFGRPCPPSASWTCFASRSSPSAGPGHPTTAPRQPRRVQGALAYSPYHNLKPGVKYPPTLITTSDHDDRVVPAHSFKFAAALQHAQTGDAPTLIRIETDAGHGAGKPISKSIEEVADRYAFLVRALDIKVPPTSAKSSGQQPWETSRARYATTHTGHWLFGPAAKAAQDTPRVRRTRTYAFFPFLKPFARPSHCRRRAYLVLPARRPSAGGAAGVHRARASSPLPGPEIPVGDLVVHRGKIVAVGAAER
jgi:predicted esterase